MIAEISPHNRSKSDCPISFWRRCWGAPLEVFGSIHSLQYLSDWAETSHDYTRHQSGQPLPVRFSDFPSLEILKSLHCLQYSSDWAGTWYDNTRHYCAQSHEQEFLGAEVWAQNLKIFGGPQLSMFTCHYVAGICISSIWEMTAASVRCFFHCIWATLMQDLLPFHAGPSITTRHDHHWFQPVLSIAARTGNSPVTTSIRVVMQAHALNGKLKLDAVTSQDQV